MTSVSSSMAEAGPSGAVRKRAFARAKRHSRFVRFYKLAIPIGSLLAVTGVGAVAYLDPFRAVRGLTLGPMSVSGTQVTMESPKLTGYRNDSRPYEVTAEAAVQDVRRPNLVELKTMKARIVTDDEGSAAHLVANVGVLDTQKEMLELRGDVRLRTDNGQEAQLSSALVNFKAGTVVSNEPVTVLLGNGTIEAVGLEVTDNGKQLHFRGRVRTVFENTGGPAQGAQPLPPTADALPPQPTSLSR